MKMQSNTVAEILEKAELVNDFDFNNYLYNAGLDNNIAEYVIHEQDADCF